MNAIQFITKVFTEVQKETGLTIPLLCKKDPHFISAMAKLLKTTPHTICKVITKEPNLPYKQQKECSKILQPKEENRLLF